ncbi:hypothetical protein D3C73_1592370 [compost metagenome]
MEDGCVRIGRGLELNRRKRARSFDSTKLTIKIFGRFHVGLGCLLRLSRGNYIPRILYAFIVSDEGSSDCQLKCDRIGFCC